MEEKCYICKRPFKYGKTVEVNHEGVRQLTRICVKCFNVVSWIDLNPEEKERLNKKCPQCNGKGFFEGDFTHEGTPSYGEGECFACNGTGETEERLNTEKEYQCECLKCGKQFSSTEIVEIPYSEYPGAFKQTDFASPCCHWHFSEIDSTCPSCGKESLTVYENGEIVKCTECQYTAQES